jgi:heme A synthase
MRATYRVLAYVIAVEVAIQAMMAVYAMAGLGIWVDKDGGVLDKASMESDLDFPGVVGFMVHGMNGMMIIPLIALVFLIVSFFAQVPGGTKWAAFVLLAVIVQVTLGLMGHENALFGMLHGLNALILFSLAFMAGKRVSPATAGSPAASVSPEPV